MILLQIEMLNIKLIPTSLKANSINLRTLYCFPVVSTKSSASYKNTIFIDIDCGMS